MTSEEIVKLIDETRNVCRNVSILVQSIKQDHCTYFIKALEQSVKNAETVEKLKTEMKSMREKAMNCENWDYATGYISAISTLEGYLAMLEKGDFEDGEKNEIKKDA
jgi:uncharacterized protein Yka (UPF0111/DUF47 family)